MNQKRTFLLLITAVFPLILLGCGQPEPVETAPVVEEVVEPTDEPDVEVGETAVSPTAIPATEAPAVEEVVEPMDGPEVEVEETAVSIQPIEVTYFTPSQQEGPYYTVEKPADRDNDLTVLAGAAAPPAGDVLEFGGKVYDANGMPIEGVVLEIWQTDANGVYLHPNDPGTASRDVNFQFYGEAVTAADGSYSFRTILPGLYEPRPRHIHVKVKLDGQELLTTQFYFTGESGAPDSGDFTHLNISLVDGQDANGNPILIGERDVVLNADLSSQ